ncbi:hybrid sensor histidine kinase/response regulator [Caulobacter sp. FWC2]|nr:hybrid sensor histidine kinase/response regulator [Caulobacter sp. FWC2]
MNDGAEICSGAALVESRGKPWRDYWPEQNRFSVDRAVASAAGGRVARFRTFDARSGAARTYQDTTVTPVCDADGTVTALVAVSHDVTAEVEAEALMRSVVQSLPSPLTVTSARSRRYVLWNRAAETLFRVDADDALGRTPEELFDPDLAKAIVVDDPEALRTGETHIAAGVAMPPALGGGVFDIKSLATFDDHGPRHVICLGEEITERLEQAKALRAALDAAERASQAKSAFLANMSHEVRTPLHGIVAGADILARAALDPKARELVDMIRGSGRTLERLLDDLLDVVQIEGDRVRIVDGPFHLGELLRSIGAMARLSLGEGDVSFSAVLPPELDGELIGDGVRLGQVIGNLVRNAVKFTERGAITLTATPGTGDRVRFEVADTGIGFDAADKARLFERFQQADASITRQFGGMGLGLSISSDLVSLMGGVLDCESTPGQGARFWFELSLPSAVASGVCGSAPAVPERALRVLVADDHPANRRIVELMLAEAAEVTCVENGLEAVRAYLTERPDVVLMDMQMPVMDGLSAVTEIRRLEAVGGQERRPIFMLTANAGDEHVRASLAAGADRHLQKPITAASLFGALQAVL